MKLRYLLPLFLLVTACETVVHETQLVEDSNSDTRVTREGQITESETINSRNPMPLEDKVTGEDVLIDTKANDDATDEIVEVECESDDICHRGFGLQYSCIEGRCGATSCETNDDCHRSYGVEYRCTVRNACEKIRCRSDIDCGDAHSTRPNCILEEGKDYGTCGVKIADILINLPEAKSVVNLGPAIKIDEEPTKTAPVEAAPVKDEVITEVDAAPETPTVDEKTASWNPEDAILRDSDKELFLFARDNESKLLQLTRKDGSWVTHGEELAIENMRLDPVSLYNPTTGKVELFVIDTAIDGEGDVLNHFSGRNGIWEKPNAPQTITTATYIESTPVAMFHSSGDIFLFVNRGYSIVQYSWKYNAQKGKTLITEDAEYRHIGNTPLKLDSKIAAVEGPEGRVFLFARSEEDQLISFMSPDGHDWGKIANGGNWLDGRQQQIGYASIKSAPVAVAGQMDSPEPAYGGAFFKGIPGDVWVFAKSNDEDTRDNESPQGFGTKLLSWSWNQTDGWGSTRHDVLKNQDGTFVAKGNQTFMGAHYTPYAESMAAVYDSVEGKVKLFGTVNNASTKTVSQYVASNVYNPESLGQTQIEGRLSAVFNSKTNELEVFGKLAQNCSYGTCESSFQQFSYEAGSFQSSSEAFGPEATGLATMSGNPVVIINDWTK